MEVLGLRRKASFAVTAASVLSLPIAGGVAAGPPTAGCPTGAAWELFEPLHPQALDHNGDGLICRLPVGDSFTWFDNVVRER